MKNLLLFLLLIPVSLFSQFVQVPTHYDCEQTAKRIIHGDLKYYLQDSIELSVEKSGGNYSTKKTNSLRVTKKVYSVFSKGTPEYSSRTNGGYIFTIAVLSKKDDTKILNTISFTVDAWTQKITEIEISKG